MESKDCGKSLGQILLLGLAVLRQAQTNDESEGTKWVKDPLHPAAPPQALQRRATRMISATLTREIVIVLR